MNGFIERNIGVMMVLIVIGVSFGGMVEIIPLMSQKVMTQPYAEQSKQVAQKYDRLKPPAARKN